MSLASLFPPFPPFSNQEQRQRLLQEMCANDSLAFPGKNRSFDDIPNKELDHLIVDDRHGIIYCYVPKVRTSLVPVPGAAADAGLCPPPASGRV